MTERDLEQSMKIDIKLDVFEGPLDLLLHLIEKNKVSIYDIPIVEITNQYMEYIREMEKTYSMESMSEFLVMAATLLKIKSKMLLPQPEKEEEEDPREELVRRLTEYKMYKYAAEELKDLSVDAQKVFFKPETVPEEIKYYEEPGLASREQVDTIPTLILYGGGQRLGAIVAPKSKAEIEAFIREALSR